MGEIFSPMGEIFTGLGGKRLGREKSPGGVFPGKKDSLITRRGALGELTLEFCDYFVNSPWGKLGPILFYPGPGARSLPQPNQNPRENPRIGI
jgi:hypothetical protein